MRRLRWSLGVMGGWWLTVLYASEERSVPPARRWPGGRAAARSGRRLERPVADLQVQDRRGALAGVLVVARVGERQRAAARGRVAGGELLAGGRRVGRVGEVGGAAAVRQVGDAVRAGGLVDEHVAELDRRARGVLDRVRDGGQATRHQRVGDRDV